jgi:radical SAM superfamily enzyme YgiQ (UPF0313 family)
MTRERPVVVLAYAKIDHERDYVYFWMPFSLLTIAKELIDCGDVDVIIFDGNRQSTSDWLETLQQYHDRLLFVGFSIMTGGGQIGHALELARAARQLVGDVPLVFGGPHVNVLREQTAEHEFVDIAISGPGQNSVPVLVNALLGRSKLVDVPGLLMKRGTGDFIRGPENPARAGLLGQYPWQLVDLEAYVRDDPTVAPRTLNYVSSQGCVYKCRFCYEQTYKRKWTAQSADLLVEDIRRLVERYSLTGIKFYDADWFIDIRRAAKICRGFTELPTPIRWAASMNPNDVRRAGKLQPDLLDVMESSGCSRILMGVESGSDRVLRDIVAKEITRAEILGVAREIAEHEILGSYTFIVGFPGETDAEVEQTYSLLDELRALSPQPETRVHLFAPYPGTPLYDEALRAGFAPPRSLAEWSNFDYYESQTPWTSEWTVRRARANTHMMLRTSEAAQC